MYSRFQSQGIRAGEEISKTKAHPSDKITFKTRGSLKITRHEIDYAEVLNYKT